MMNISEAEAVVMEALWQRHPLSSEDLVAELGPRQSWQPATVKTLLNRLLNKGAVTASRDGRRYWYSPRLRREDWLAEQSTGLVDRLFGGSLAPLPAAEKAQLATLSATVRAEWAQALDARGKPGNEVLKAFTDAMK